MSKKDIDLNMLRERAEKLEEITDEQWKEITDRHKDLVDEWLKVNSFRPKTLIQYRSAIRIFFWYLKTVANKEFYKVKKRDFMRYMAWLRDRGLSSSSIKFKRSAVSSFCNYIENVVAEDDDELENFKHFVRGTPTIPPNKVYEKEKITYEEHLYLIEELEKRGMHMAACWVSVAFNVGARKAELLQFRSDIANMKIPEGKKFVKIHKVFGKGKGDGKILEYMFNQEALDAVKKWVSIREYDHEYIFTIVHGGQPKVASENWITDLCANILSPILGRRINAHIFKASMITHRLEVEKLPIEIVSKLFGMHNDVSTTQIYNLMNVEDMLDEFND